MKLNPKSNTQQLTKPASRGAVYCSSGTNTNESLGVTRKQKKKHAFGASRHLFFYLPNTETRFHLSNILESQRLAGCCSRSTLWYPCISEEYLKQKSVLPNHRRPQQRRDNSALPTQNPAEKTESNPGIHREREFPLHSLCAARIIPPGRGAAAEPPACLPAPPSSSSPSPYMLL